MKYAFVCFLATALQGQIYSIVTNADGAELEFLSSLGTEADPDRTFRHYRYTAHGPEVVFRAENPYFAIGPTGIVLSDDGGTRGTVKYRPCFGGSCGLGGYFPRTTVSLVRNGKAMELAPQGWFVAISRNGRWMYDPGYPLYAKASLTDLDTGRAVEMPALMADGATHVIADDGSVVGRGDDGLTLAVAGADGTTLFAVPEGKVVFAAVSQDGRKLFAATDRAVYEFDRATRARRELYRTEGLVGRVTPSATGERVLVQTERDVVLIDSGGPHVWYTAPEPLGGSVLAADGRTAYVTTSANRVVRIVDGVATEVYAAFPSMARQMQQGVIAGSLVRFAGGPFPEGMVLTVGGRVFPEVAVTADSYEVQMPWEFEPTQSPAFTLSRPGSPFVLTGSLLVTNRPTAQIYVDYGIQPGFPLAKAAQADFRSLVSEKNPAPAGSTVHFWLTGLGALDRPVATGEKGPVNPPARPLAPLACYILNDSGVPAVRGLELPFVAYAPGLVGVYQVDAVIPADWPAGLAYLTCAVGEQPATSVAGLYIRGN